MTATNDAIGAVPAYGGVAGKGTRGKGCILCGRPLRQGPVRYECGWEDCPAFGKQVALKRTHDPRPESYDVLLDRWRQQNGTGLPSGNEPKCISCTRIATGEERLALVEPASHRIMAHCKPGEGCLARKS